MPSAWNSVCVGWVLADVGRQRDILVFLASPAAQAPGIAPSALPTDCPGQVASLEAKLAAHTYSAGIFGSALAPEAAAGPLLAPALRLRGMEMREGVGAMAAMLSPWCSSAREKGPEGAKTASGVADKAHRARAVRRCSGQLCASKAFGSRSHGMAAPLGSSRISSWLQIERAGAAEARQGGEASPGRPWYGTPEVTDIGSCSAFRRAWC